MKLKISAVVLFMSLASLAALTPAYAQDNGAANSSPAGVGILILIMGLGALLMIGGAYSLGGRKGGSAEHPENMDDDE